MAFWNRSDESQPAAGNSRGGTANLPAGKAPADPSEGTHAGGAAPALDPDQLAKMAAAAKAQTAAFGEIVALLMHSPQYKYLTLSDMEWLVLPALLTGQFSLATAQSKASGLTSPVGLVLWASVSQEVDKRLSAAAEQPVRLNPQEWKSGDIRWVILAVGEQRIVKGMFQALHAKQWAHRPAKALARDKDGRPTIITIESKALAGAQAGQD
jgi:cytolysin-activating lysine-acyltransferase